MGLYLGNEKITNVEVGESVDNAVTYNKQTPTETQKEQARQNIDVLSKEEVTTALEGKAKVESDWEKVEEFSVDASAPVSKFTDSKGKPYQFKKMYLVFIFPANADGSAPGSVLGHLKADGTRGYQIASLRSISGSNVQYARVVMESANGFWFSKYNRTSLDKYSYADTVDQGYNYDFKNRTLNYPHITGFSTTGNVPAGTRIEVWAVRENGDKEAVANA